jgi:BirA family biotin operon repressor/biotin-[acetyl-CoA-carboxylase] ligase
MVSANESRLGCFFGNIFYFDEVTSTNDLALEWAANGAIEGTVIVARAQTAGRGRQGRRWVSLADGGLYASLILRPCQVLPLLTHTVGVALAESLRALTDLEIELKWPNDLVIKTKRKVVSEYRKIGGILTESAGCSGSCQYVVVGFGINLEASNLPIEVAKLATSVEAELGYKVDSARLMVESLAAFVRWHKILLERQTDVILNRWRALSPSSEGAHVEWRRQSEWHGGMTVGIDDGGALLVRDENQVERVLAGEIRWFS